MLAMAYQSGGLAKQAVKLLEQVLRIQKSTLIENHPNLLVSQVALAEAYTSDGQVKEAVELLELVLRMQETELTKDLSLSLFSRTGSSSYQPSVLLNDLETAQMGSCNIDSIDTPHDDSGSGLFRSSSTLSRLASMSSSLSFPRPLRLTGRKKPLPTLSSGMQSSRGA